MSGLRTTRIGSSSILPTTEGSRGLGESSEVITQEDHADVKEVKTFVKGYQGDLAIILVTGAPGVGKSTLCNHMRSIMNAKGPCDNYVSYTRTRPGSHSGSVTSLFETYTLGGNERVCLQDGKGLEDGDLGLLELAITGRLMNNFDMTVSMDAIKEAQAKRGANKRLTEEDKKILDRLRSGNDDDPELERFRPKAVFVVLDATALGDREGEAMVRYRDMVEKIHEHEIKVCIILNKCDGVIGDLEERRAIWNDPVSLLDRPEVERLIEEVSEDLGVEPFDVYPMLAKPKRKELSPAHSLLVIRPFGFILSELKKCARESVHDPQECAPVADDESDDED